MQIMHNSAGFGEYPRQTLHNPAHYAKPIGSDEEGPQGENSQQKKPESQNRTSAKVRQRSRRLAMILLLCDWPLRANGLTPFEVFPIPIPIFDAHGAIPGEKSEGISYKVDGEGLRPGRAGGRSVVREV